MSTAHLTRRRFTLLAGAAALLPLSASAQGLVEFEAFAARCRELTGFDPLPRHLVVALAEQLTALEKRSVIDGGPLRATLQNRILTALYTGVYEAGGESDGVRIGYQDALMHAAVEDTLNVPSYCGGLPAYWAEKPALG